MKVILTETIESLGIIGTEVTVANGYARNYLLPQDKAVKATPSNRKRLEQDRKKFELQIAKERKFAEEMAGRLDGVSCTIAAKVADETRLYGSVTAREIIMELAKQNVEIEKRMLLMTEPIKELGEYRIPVRVYKDVEPEIIVRVVSDAEPEMPAIETAAAEEPEPVEAPEEPRTSESEVSGASEAAEVAEEA